MPKEFCGNGGKVCPKFCMLAVKVKGMYVQQINYVNDSRGPKHSQTKEIECSGVCGVV